MGAVILPPKSQEEEERFEKVPIRYSSSNIVFLLKKLDRDCYGVHAPVFLALHVVLTIILLLHLLLVVLVKTWPYRGGVP